MQDGRRCGLYNLSEDLFYHMDVPEVCRDRCCGSSQGWLLISSQTPSLFMLNPITRSRIELPPVTAFKCVLDYDQRRIDREYKIAYLNGVGVESRSSTVMQNTWIKRVVLSGNPSVDKDYKIMVLSDIYGDIDFYRRGDDKWTHLESGIFNDVVYWKGVFYALGCDAKLLSCDLNGALPVVRTIIDCPILAPRLADNQNYLVVSGGELLLIARIYDRYTVKGLRDKMQSDVFGAEKMEENPNVNGNFEKEQVHNPLESDATDFSNDVVDDHVAQSFIDSDEEGGEDDSNSGSEEDYYFSSEEEGSADEYYRTDAELEEILKVRLATKCFRVYKLDMENKTWTMVQNIGDQALFVGHSGATSVDARDFPNCKPNHIYFTDDKLLLGWTWDNDIGVMNLETNKVVQLLPGCSELKYLLQAAPVWMMPSL